MIWWDESWNPVIGCTKCSPACENCYAEDTHTKRHKALLAGKKMPPCYAKPFDRVRFLSERLEQPLHWKKPKRIFVGNMGDLFHADVPDALLDQIFWTMALCPQHTFMLCTKRPERMREYIENYLRRKVTNVPWPLPNVWLGTTIWDQASADRAVPILLSTPAAKRFVSVEPLLGPVDLTAINMESEGYYSGLYINSLITSTGNYGETYGQVPDWHGLDWVICGGETGPGARPMHPDWPRSLRDQCQAAKVPFFFKQWGEYGPTKLRETLRQVLDKTNGRFHLDADPDCKGKMSRLGTRKAGRALDVRTWEEVPNA